MANFPVTVAQYDQFFIEASTAASMEQQLNALLASLTKGVVTSVLAGAGGGAEWVVTVAVDNSSMPQLVTVYCYVASDAGALKREFDAARARVTAADPAALIVSAFLAGSSDGHQFLGILGTTPD
jgi:hypothetical protein